MTVEKIRPRTTEELLDLVRKMVCGCTDAYCSRRNIVDILARRLSDEVAP